MIQLPKQPPLGKLAPAKLELLLSAIIFAIACLIYANTATHGFVFDDQAVLSENTFVKEGTAGLKKIFTTGSWLGYNPDRNLHIYRPLQLAVLAIQYEFFGLNPLPYHIVHILSYGLLCSLVYLLLHRILIRAEKGTWIALIGSILFTLHPVHTEVVANIKGNGDLLAMLFGTITLLLIQKFGETGRWKLIGLSFLSFLIALLFKETVITTLGVAGLMLYYFSDLKIKRIFICLLPLLLSVGAYLTARNLVFGGDANTLEGTTTNISNVILLADGWSQEVGLRMYALGKNLMLLIFPYPLLMMYVYDSIPMVEAFEMASLFPAAIYTAITLFFFFGIKKKSLLSFAAGFYLTSIFLFSNILFSIPNIVSERWLLLPSLPFCLAVAIIFVNLSVYYKRTVSITLALICFGYAGYTIQRNLAWKSNLTLALTDVETAPKNFNVLRLAGSQLFAEAKRNDMDPEMLRESAHYMEMTLRITANDAKRRNTLGIAYEKLGNHDLAALEFEKAMQHDTDVKEKARYSYAKNQVIAGNHLRALLELDRLELDYPKHAGVKSLKGTALKELGKQEDAVKSLNESLMLDPNDPRANQSLGEFYLEEAKANQLNLDYLKLSAKHYEQWLKYFDGTANEKLRPYNTLGQVYEQMGAHALAAKSFSLAAAGSSSIRSKAQFSAAKNFNDAGEYDSALEIWSALELKYPQEIGVRIGNCIALIGKKADSDLILKSSNQLLQLIKANNQTLKPNQATKLNKIAITLEQQNHHKLSAELFLEASKCDSSVRGKAAFSAAKNFHAAGSYENALKQWEFVEQEYPEVLEVMFRKASTLEAMERREEAKEVYTELLLRTSPNSPSANEKDYNRAQGRIDRL